MKLILTFAIAIIFVLPAFSQFNETDSISKAKISQLDFMVETRKEVAG